MALKNHLNIFVLIFSIHTFWTGLEAAKKSIPEPRHAASRKPVPIQRFVYNGRPAKAAQFPYMVALVNGDKIHCGGSLVGPLHVVTASHCLLEE